MHTDAVQPQLLPERAAPRLAGLADCMRSVAPLGQERERDRVARAGTAAEAVTRGAARARGLAAIGGGRGPAREGERCRMLHHYKFLSSLDGGRHKAPRRSGPARKSVRSLPVHRTPRRDEENSTD